MLLTISTTQSPATDLGYLLHKHPDRVTSFPLSFGTAHVFYPEATSDRCTFALLLEVDPVGLSRKEGDGAAGPLEPYVNDRPYVASSFLSVAIAQVLGTALSGRCGGRPELAQSPMPLLARVAVLACRGGEGALRRLFEPLGYCVDIEHHPLDPAYPAWTPSPIYSVTLRATVRVKDLLSHLYVLIPVLDDEKHYYVGADEVDKLLRHGEGWLANHPEHAFIARRYLKHQATLVREATQRLIGEETQSESDDASAKEQESTLEGPLTLNKIRLGAVVEALAAEKARSVVDLGCGEGKLVRLLLKDRRFERVVGMDVSQRALEIGAARLNLDHMSESERARVDLWHGSLLYRDKRVAGFDAATVIEVIEHLDAERVPVFTRILFGETRPRTVIVTTPNADYNVRFTHLPAGKLRHPDHRFEWTRGEFEAWARATGEAHGYAVRFLPVGAVDEAVGAPTQMAVFGRKEAS